MMIAVLLEARKPGSSGWVRVRDTQKVRVSGLEGGHLYMEFRCNGFSIQDLLDCDCVYDIPSGMVEARAKLERVTDRTNLSVDLER
jgi:hypothetical protein